MLTVLGSNVKLKLGPTATSTVVLVAEGTPLTSGWPFSSKIVIGAAASSFLGLVLTRLSPDSARTKNTIVNMTAVQKIGRTAFNLFILLLLLYAPGSILVYRTAADALRFNAGNIAQEVLKKASRIFSAEGHSLCSFTREGNRIVTRAAPRRLP
jgi:hypothetical protein